jgi:hypothetical protein
MDIANKTICQFLKLEIRRGPSISLMPYHEKCAYLFELDRMFGEFTSLNTRLMDFAYLHTRVFSMAVGSVIKRRAGFYCWSGRVLV